MKKTPSKLEENLKKVNLLIDNLGCPIDDKIKLPVATLMSLDFITISSCSGHYPSGTPYIDIGSQSALDFEHSVEVDKLVRIMRSGTSNPAYQQRYEELSKKVVVENTLEGKRLFQYLKDFYRYRQYEEDVRLVVGGIAAGFGGYRIYPHGNFFMEMLTNKEKLAWLESTQYEFQLFSEFLRDKIDL